METNRRKGKDLKLRFLIVLLIVCGAILLAIVLFRGSNTGDDPSLSRSLNEDVPKPHGDSIKQPPSPPSASHSQKPLKNTEIESDRQSSKNEGAERSNIFEDEESIEAIKNDPDKVRQAKEHYARFPPPKWGYHTLQQLLKESISGSRMTPEEREFVDKIKLWCFAHEYLNENQSEDR